MSSACRAITVNVRERYVETGQRRGKTSDEPFHQHAMNTGTAVIKQQIKLARDRMWQSQTAGCFFKDMVTNIYVRESKFVSCLTLIRPIWSEFLSGFEPLIKTLGHLVLCNANMSIKVLVSYDFKLPLTATRGNDSNRLCHICASVELEPGDD